MRVKIGNVWHNCEDEPICIQISKGEQEQIASLDRRIATEGKYAIFPDSCGLTKDQMLAWMEG